MFAGIKIDEDYLGVGEEKEVSVDEKQKTVPTIQTEYVQMNQDDDAFVLLTTTQVDTPTTLNSSNTSHEEDMTASNTASSVCIENAPEDWSLIQSQSLTQGDLQHSFIVPSDRLDGTDLVDSLMNEEIDTDDETCSITEESIVVQQTDSSQHLEQAAITPQLPTITSIHSTGEQTNSTTFDINSAVPEWAGVFLPGHSDFSLLFNTGLIACISMIVMSVSELLYHHSD